jgi:hypothetical protein
VEKSKKAMDSQGLWVKQKVSYTLPGKKTKRHAFIFKKEGLG